MTFHYHTRFKTWVDERAIGVIRVIIWLLGLSELLYKARVVRVIRVIRAIS